MLGNEHAMLAPAQRLRNLAQEQQSKDESGGNSRIARKYERVRYRGDTASDFISVLW
jgi:hypothetical protein